jgi:hypothetical protein
MKNLSFIHRLNQKSAPLRTAVDSGHGAYNKPPPTRADDPRWQLPPCKPEGPEHDMAVLQANLQRARLALEAAELASIELDPDKLKRKRRTVGKSGIPPLEAA